MEEKQYDVPILLILFKRIDSTKLILNELRKQRPKYIYIVADGPRNKEEKKETDKLREFVLKEIDWPCTVNRKFREENWGCDNSSVDALNWFFKNVEYGIFLEDDCIPSQSLFEFHKEILERYKDEERVKCVCGTNFIEKRAKFETSYGFSKQVFSGWGFATWSRAWKIDRQKIKNTINSKNKIFSDPAYDFIYKKKLNDVISGKIEGWDHLFSATIALESGLRVVPAKNLVENTGFEGDSSHEFDEVDKKYLNIKRESLGFPLVHPRKIKRNKFFDIMTTLNIVSRISKKRIRKLLDF